MSIAKRLGVLVIAGIIVIGGSELGERLFSPRVSQCDPDCSSQSRASAHARERCRGSAALGAALRGGRI